MAGGPVRCPLCTQVFQVPELSVPPQPMVKSPPVVDSRLQFACPQCQSAFQVSESVLGQAVACPSCKSPVQLPAAKAGAGIQEVPPANMPGAPLPNIVTEPDRAVSSDVANSEHEAGTTGDSDQSTPVLPGDPVANGTKQPTSPKPKTVDDLLPPKFTRTLPQIATNAVALDGVILHEPVRTVQSGNQTRNLVVVSDEVKARRRMIRNVLMFGFGSLLLIVAAKLLIR